MYVERTSTDKINVMELDRCDSVRIKDSLRRATLQCELTAEEKQRFESMIRKIQIECDNLAPGYYDSKL